MQASRNGSPLRPRIGLPLCLDDRGRWRDGREYAYIDDAYARAIADAGGAPLLLPIQSDFEPLIDGLDGLLLPGGDDFASDRPLPPEVSLDLVPDRQLDFDTALLAAARARGLPVLAICYGMQLLARASGGELEPHLPSAGVDADEHRLPDADRHEIEIVAGSRLEALLGSGAHRVNSLHHQAVRSLGPAHRAVATGTDGVLEAIEDPTRWEIGVQWHPEKMKEATSRALFGGFVEASRVFAETARPGDGR